MKRSLILGNIDQNERIKKKTARFDEAIAICGYGKFHIYLYVSMVFAQFTAALATTQSYVIANAECDLQMTLDNKGLLNAIVYVGMLSSGLFSGFLADVFGRKPFIVWGYLLVGLCYAIKSICQTFTFLVVLDFLIGFLVIAPFAAHITYMGEMHDDKIRSKVMLYTFCTRGIGNILVVASAWIILPNDWGLYYFNDKFVFRPWQLFMLVNSSYAIITSILFSFLPESPKFLLNQRKPGEALDVLKKIYFINTGKSMDTYPVEKLYVCDDNEPAVGFYNLLKNGVRNIKPLFANKTYIAKLIQICSIHMFINA